MRKILEIIANAIMWALTIFCIWGFIMFDTIGTKLISSVVVLMICPLINRWFVRKISNRYAMGLRVILCVVAFMTELILILVSPVEMNEKVALKEAANLLEAQYADYQMLDIKDYEILVGEERNGIQQINMGISFIATKDGDKKKINEKIILYFDTSTGKYLREKPKGE